MDQLEFSLNDPRGPKKYRNSYIALLSLLECKDIRFNSDDIKKECRIIKMILKKGHTDKQILQAVNYILHRTKRKPFNSYALLLWKDCKVLKDALNNSIVLEAKKEKKIKLEDKDFRGDVKYEPSKPTLRKILS